MTASRYMIGQLAKATGCKVPTIRYYEQIGLLPEPARNEGNQRIYSDQHLKRLSFIRHARELGFSQEAIRELLQLTADPDATCDTADDIARTHLEDVKHRIRRLQSLQAELERMIACCGGRRVRDCRIIETLADYSHGHCLNPDHSGETA